MEIAPRAGNEEGTLWLRLRGGEEVARQNLLALHMPYARTVASVYYARRFSDDVEFGDYLQYASIGLLEALDRFDPARGVQFRTFAARRMHGAILNGLERLTEKQQQIAARQRMRRDRVQDVKAAALEADDVPAAATRHPEQLMRFVSEVGIGLALCWMLEGTALVEAADAGVTIPFYRNAAIKELRARLMMAIAALPPQEQAVIRHHYIQDLQFEEIAGMLQLTKGRISQIHKQALLRLRALVRERAEWDATF
jgi:RNA polymerase sigma factor for flagellar operon FliA